MTTKREIHETARYFDAGKFRCPTCGNNGNIPPNTTSTEGCVKCGTTWMGIGVSEAVAPYFKMWSDQGIPKRR